MPSSILCRPPPEAPGHQEVVTAPAKSHSVFFLPQKGETVKRIREQVRLEFGRAAQGIWFGGEGRSLPHLFPCSPPFGMSNEYPWKVVVSRGGLGPGRAAGRQVPGKEVEKEPHRLALCVPAEQRPDHHL